MKSPSHIAFNINTECWIAFMKTLSDVQLFRHRYFAIMTAATEVDDE